MKKNMKLFSLLVLVWLQVPAFAQRHDYSKPKTKYAFVKDKSFSKSYPVSPSEKLNIKNEFGSVEIKTWTRNEFKVDVAIEVSANSEDLAQRLLDAITISDKQDEGEVSCATSMQSSDNGKEGKSNMTINYTVYMPASNPLQVQNEFGPTVIPDLSGALDISTKFGSLTTGTLTSPKNKIQVEFGNAKFESLSNMKTSIKYSKVEFSKLTGNIKLDLEFCSAVRIHMGNDLGSLDVRASYSTVNIQPSGGLSASYNISTNFGSFRNKTDIKLDEESSGTDRRYARFNHRYEGKSGSGAVQVKVDARFGKIILGEATEEDMKSNRSRPGRFR
jgi:hypothetical protein